MSEQPGVADAFKRAPESEISVLLRASKPGSADRRKLLRRLENEPTRSNIGLLGEYLNSADARDGVTAVQTLQRIETEPAIATLAEGLSTALPLVGAYIARALIHLDARGELPAIISYLRDRRDTDAGNKQFVIDAMRNKMPHVSEVTVLAESLHDPRLGLRKSAARALVSIRAPESTAALRAAADELGYWKGRQARKGLRLKQGID